MTSKRSSPDYLPCFAMPATLSGNAMVLKSTRPASSQRILLQQELDEFETRKRERAEAAEAAHQKRVAKRQKKKAKKNAKKAGNAAGTAAGSRISLRPIRTRVDSLHLCLAYFCDARTLVAGNALACFCQRVLRRQEMAGKRERTEWVHEILLKQGGQVAVVRIY